MQLILTNELLPQHIEALASQTIRMVSFNVLDQSIMITDEWFPLVIGLHILRLPSLAPMVT